MALPIPSTNGIPVNTHLIDIIGSGISVPLPIIASQALNQGDLTYFDVANNTVRQLDTDAHAEFLCGIAQQYNPVSSIAPEVEITRCGVQAGSVYNMQTTAGDNYNNGDLVYVNPESSSGNYQTITKTVTNASQTVTVSGTITAGNVASLQVGKYYVEHEVVAADTTTTIAAALEAALQALPGFNKYLTASSSGAVATISSTRGGRDNGLFVNAQTAIGTGASNTLTITVGSATAGTNVSGALAGGTSSYPVGRVILPVGTIGITQSLSQPIAGGTNVLVPVLIFSRYPVRIEE